MPPKPRHGEGGPYRGFGADVRGFVERYDMTTAEATEVIMMPLGWMERLRDEEDVDVVISDATAILNRYETQYGPSTDWDDARIALGQALIAMDQVRKAADLLTSAHEVSRMLSKIATFVASAVRTGALELDDLLDITLEIQDAFVREGRGDEFFAESLTSLGQFEPVIADTYRRFTSPPAEAEPMDERERYARASWTDIDGLVDQEEYWPEGTAEDARRGFASRFAELQHAMLEKPKVARKDAEALKAFINEQQGEGEVWDRFRFIAALTMYDASAPNFGRIMARSMTDPEMQAMITHALIERGRERDAMDALQDIPDAKLFGRMLYLADWSDRAPIDAMIADITQATHKNNKKYIPQMRIDTTLGLQEALARRQADAVAADDTETAARLQAEAEAMGKRAELLIRQKDMGFIVAPRKR